MTEGGRARYPAPFMARLNPRYTPRHHFILYRALTRREVHPAPLQKFLRLFGTNPFHIGVTHIMADSRIDVQTLIGIANRIGAAEDGMDQAQAVINNAQAAKDAATAQAAALVAKAVQDVTDAQGKLAAATGDYKAANADLLSFVQGLDVPAAPAPPAPAS